MASGDKPNGTRGDNTVPAMEFGLEGPGSIAVSTQSDPERRVVVEGFLEVARAIRPVLRARQAETESDRRYSEEVHRQFEESGLYRLMMPKRFGGYEFSVSDFYLVVAEIARGCPETAWCYCLGSAHSLQLSSYWPLAVQEEIYADYGYFIAPNSGNWRGVDVKRIAGGYTISGTWRYSSGSPYSTHFLPVLQLPDTPEGTLHWVIVPRRSYEVLDDWGGILGMRGSGSNTIRLTDAFVPDRYVVLDDFTSSLDGPTAGTEAFGNSLYGGPFEAFAVGEISAITVGLGYAALDEYRRIITTTRAVLPGDGGVLNDTFRIQHHDWQRSYGLAMAKVDAAAALSVQNGRLYDTYSRRSVEREAAFSEEQTFRLRDSNMVVQDMIFDAVALMLRGTGSSALLDGAKMQRYFRDITTAVTRTNQLDFAAALATKAMVAESNS